MLRFSLKAFWKSLWGHKQTEKEIPKDFSVPTKTSTPSQESYKRATASRKSEDMSAENQLAIFLDKYLYSCFPNKDSFQSIERVYDKELQLSGVDVRLVDQSDRTFNIDEKAQLYYLNKGLPTFAFEIEFLRSGIPTTGWLCNNTLVTDFYLLIWPYASQDSPKNILWHQFEKAECLSIQKKKLLKVLQDLGLSQKQLAYDAKRIRDMHQFGKHAIPGISGIYYYASNPQKYSEAPINLVVSKSRLTQIATKKYIVTKGGVACN